MTAGTHLGCAPQGSTTESSPAEADVEAGPATVILTMYLSNNHQGTLTRQGLLLMVLEGTQHCISHTARSQRERERESTDLGSAFIGVRVRYLGFHGFTLLGEFKTQKK